jgi:hypothetical protein
VKTDLLPCKICGTGPGFPVDSSGAHPECIARAEEKPTTFGRLGNPVTNAEDLLPRAPATSARFVRVGTLKGIRTNDGRVSLDLSVEDAALIASALGLVDRDPRAADLRRLFLGSNPWEKQQTPGLLSVDEVNAATERLEASR